MCLPTITLPFRYICLTFIKSFQIGDSLPRIDRSPSRETTRARPTRPRRSALGGGLAMRGRATAVPRRHPFKASPKKEVSQPRGSPARRCDAAVARPRAIKLNPPPQPAARASVCTLSPREGAGGALARHRPAGHGLLPAVDASTSARSHGYTHGRRRCRGSVWHCGLQTQLPMRIL
jgi:hypothetical protein